MMRSMSSAVTSLKNHQTKMDVIGNNIANVSTTAFKSGRVTFKDTYNQMVRGAAGSTDDRGGLNPHQVGLGMTTSSIDNAMGSGNIDTTGIGTDVYIEGEGFFEVKSSDGVYYTRDGNFIVDEEGYLITQDGRYIQGYQADKDGNIIETKDRIRIPIVDVINPNPTSEVRLEGVLDSRAGSGIDPANWPAKEDIYSIVQATANFGDEAKYSIKAEYSDNPTLKRSSILARSQMVQVYDSLGGEHDIRIDFLKSKDQGSGVYDIQVFYVKPNGNMIPATNAMMNGTTNDLQLEFGPDGRLKDPNNSSMTIKLDPTSINGASPIEATIDLSALTMFETASDVEIAKNDGYPLGKLSEFEIGADGMVMATYDNGDKKSLGQIILNTFANVNGLKKEGNNLWSPTQNSGDPNTVRPGSGSAGILRSGALEMSNVDLAKEFTQMIITQRGFQANARTISTTDQMLEELVNLKR